MDSIKYFVAKLCEQPKFSATSSKFQDCNKAVRESKTCAFVGAQPGWVLPPFG